ncbi:MAG: hypothetical protein H0U55_02510 [Rubrobacteraceae bacterium]|jgi:hypothetical protein|nr:hypothetical protein [Rubrobacteraceae bacterium]
MARCAGFKPDDSPCERIVPASRGYCYSHDPDRADERRRNASRAGKRGGRGRPAAELSALKRRLEELAEDVLEGRKNRQDAAVAGQLLNYAIRAVSVTLRARESEELEAKLEELSEAFEQQQEARRRGA